MSRGLGAEQLTCAGDLPRSLAILLMRGSSMGFLASTFSANPAAGLSGVPNGE